MFDLDLRCASAQLTIECCIYNRKLYEHSDKLDIIIQTLLKNMDDEYHLWIVEPYTKIHVKCKGLYTVNKPQKKVTKILSKIDFEKTLCIYLYIGGKRIYLK